MVPERSRIPLNGFRIVQGLGVEMHIADIGPLATSQNPTKRLNWCLMGLGNAAQFSPVISRTPAQPSELDHAIHRPKPSSVNYVRILRRVDIDARTPLQWNLQDGSRCY